MKLSTEPLQLRAAIFQPRQSELPLWRTLIFGVLLPLVAILFYLYIEPDSDLGILPTPWHTALVFLVPIANTWLLAGQRRFAAALTGASLAISFVYSLLLLPLVPLSLIAFIFVVGALGLSPYGAVYIALLIRKRLRLTVWPGLVAMLAIYAVLEGREALTHYGLGLATSSQDADRARGMSILHTLGEDSVIRNAAEGRHRFYFDLWGGLARFTYPVSSLDARKVWYQLHGEPLESRSIGPWGWDQHRGSATVGGKLPGLAVASSQIDGSVDAQAALTYTEWTLEFENSGTIQQEARAELLLPTGGVVSRATLWINGEEREAVFGERGKVRQAYERVVAFRRDPLLVTTHGPGHAMIQCFPVQPQSKMKIRIGVTAPLELTTPTEFGFRLPAFAETNFNVPGRAKQAVWIDYGQRGGFHKQIDNDVRVIPIPRSAADGSAWTPGPQNTAIVQLTQHRTFDPSLDWTVVIDASEKVKPYAAEIKSALAGRANIHWLAASDQAQRPAHFDDIAFRGGMDNVPALLDALNDGHRILWIHAPQREELFASPQLLKQQWDRKPTTPELYSLEVIPGPDRILAALDGIPQVKSLSRTSSLKNDILRLTAATDEEVLTREQLPLPAKIPAAWGKRTSDHLARLWASDQIQANLKTDRPAALELARQYRLVTPVTGAVVLETQQQYDAAGLTADPTAKVPTIPEPEVWMLLIIALSVIVYARRRATC